MKLLQLLLVTAIWPSSIFASERNVRVLDPYSPKRVLKKKTKKNPSNNPPTNPPTKRPKKGKGVPTASPVVPTPPPTKRPTKSKKSKKGTPAPTVAPPTPTLVEFSFCTTTCDNDARALRGSESFRSSLQRAAVAGTDINPNDVEVVVTVEESSCSVECGGSDRRRLQEENASVVEAIIQLAYPGVSPEQTRRSLEIYGADTVLAEILDACSGSCSSGDFEYPDTLMPSTSLLPSTSPTIMPTTGRRKRTLINGFDDNFNGYDDRFETDDY